jgi:deoxyribonuclease V
VHRRLSTRFASIDLVRYFACAMSWSEWTARMDWPATAEELIACQERLSSARPPPWAQGRPWTIGGCFVCFPRAQSGVGARGDRAWAAAASLREGSASVAAVEGAAGAPYVPGLLALREGPLLEAAVRALPAAPDVLLVDATGRDHPRRAGLATLLGALLDLPTVGVTHRPLIASGRWPDAPRGATAPLAIGDEIAGCWLRVRTGRRPLAVSPGWRTELDIAVEVVLAATARVRTPEPLRLARTAARRARAASR